MRVNNVRVANKPDITRLFSFFIFFFSFSRRGITLMRYTCAEDPSTVSALHVGTRWNGKSYGKSVGSSCRRPLTVDKTIGRIQRRCTMATGSGGSNAASLPYFAAGPIVKGFGRGSRALGIPTANFPEDVVERLPSDFANGIYYGWAAVDGNVYKMVMSIGWNPFYKNKKKTMETHILDEFSGALHGKELRIVVTGYIRPEKDFSSVDDLIKEIKNDIAIADKCLDETAMSRYKEHQFLR